MRVERRGAWPVMVVTTVSMMPTTMAAVMLLTKAAVAMTKLVTASGVGAAVGVVGGLAAGSGVGRCDV
jgi:hypothetical protein